jgi:hypothetical protein
VIDHVGGLILTQHSQSGFCRSFMRRKRCQRCVVCGH